MGTDYLVNFPGLGIYNLPISRMAFEFNLFGRNIVIYWYGIVVSLAMVIGMFLALHGTKKHKTLSSDDITDVFLAVVPFSIIGARLYYVAFTWENYAHNLKAIFDTRSGGMAYYGGVIGAALGILLVCKIRHLRFYSVADHLAVYLPLCHGIGRLANFFNQEAFGFNTNLPWGMYSNGTFDYLTRLNASANPNSMVPKDLINPNLPVHPTFLYEFLGNLLIFLVLLVIRKKSKRPMVLTECYLLGYGILRFFVEAVRTDALFIPYLNLRVSQVLSLVLVLVSILLLIINFITSSRDKRLKREMKLRSSRLY